MRVDSPGTVVWFHREQRHWGLGICVLKPKKEYTGVLREVLPPGEKSNWGSHLFYFALLSSLNNCLWTVCSTSAAVTDVRSHDVRAACAPWTLLWFIEKNIFPNIWCFVSLDQKFLTRLHLILSKSKTLLDTCEESVQDVRRTLTTGL